VQALKSKVPLVVCPALCGRGVLADEGEDMYAVIRTGGKQYRVAPGDVIKVEKLASVHNSSVEFTDVLAVSSGEGKIGGPQGETRVVGHVLGEGRADKILVFHFKRKKQYKKLAGHRQPFTTVRITEITYDGQKFAAPALPEKKAKAPKPKAEAAPAVKAEASEAAAPAKKAKAKTAAKPAAKKSATPKASAKKPKK